MLISLSKFCASILLLFAKFFSGHDVGRTKQVFVWPVFLQQGELGRLEESETSITSTRARSTICHKIKRKFNKCMDFFLKGGGSCSYDDEIVGDIEVPLRYKNLVKQWVPRDIPQVNTDFCVNERIYRIAPLSLHGLGLFFMDGIKVGYDRLL